MVFKQLHDHSRVLFHISKMTVEYSREIETPPRHLGLEFFEEILENALRLGNPKIDKINFKMGSCIGENYCSQIYRVQVQYRLGGKSDQLSVIIKSMPPSTAMQFLEDMQVFLKEKLFYNNTLPLMELFLDVGQKFGARLYHSLKHPVKTLAFEDLSASGYRMASRESGLDEAHCRLVMRKLGQFHGISMVLENKDPEMMKFFNAGMLSKEALQHDEGFLMTFFGVNAAALAELTASWSGYEEITRKINKYRANLRENLCRSQLSIDGEIKVLNHGDLWVNNILFKYDNEECHKVKDVVFVDFQMSIWGSPGLDLNYFFYTSLQLNILKTQRESLIKEYYESLKRTLRELHSTHIPTLQDIMQEVERRELYGFFANYGIFPTIAMDKEQCSDNKLDNFLGEEFTRNKVRQMFASKRLEETLKYTLRRFNQLGLWD